jgi:hypothetical protein
MNSNSLAMSGGPAAGAGGEHEKQAVNPGKEEKTESGPVTATPIVACGFQERLDCCCGGF